MESLLHNGRVVFIFDSESEIRYLKMMLDSVDKSTLEKSIAKLPTSDLINLGSFGFYLKHSLILHLPECVNADINVVLKDLNDVVLDSWGNRGLLPPA